MASYNKRISDQSKVKFNPINRELEDSENSELDSRVDNLEENILGSKTATGNPITVTDAAPVNAVNLSMDLEPIQAGSGKPSPDNIRPISGRSEVDVQMDGRNLFDESAVTNGEVILYTTGNTWPDADWYTSDYIPVISGDKYTFSGICLISTGEQWWYDKDKQPLLAADNNATKTVPNGAYYFRFSRKISDGYVGQIEKGSQPTNYQPYAGKTYTIQLGDTVYGGTLDVTRGKMVVDRGYIASYNGETLPSTWISDRDVYASETSPTTGAQVVYELATPITIDLTPQQIKMLENTNTIYTDYEGDTITIEYRLNNAIGEVLNELDNIYNKIDDIYNKIGSLDTRVTALEES